MSTDAPGRSSTENRRVPEIPDFDLLRVIGRGGFGEVWIARNRATGQLRAVKLIPRARDGRANPAGREAVSLALLDPTLRRQHPNLLTIHHVGQTPGYLFYVMDLADDAAAPPALDPATYRPDTLDRRLAHGPLPSSEALECARQLLSGLAILHGSGMVHRDVKPANCLFVGGALKLADFGLLAEADEAVSRLGTEKYMPPDGHMDARADVYAAGLVLYETITGFPADRFPQLGERAGAIMADPTLSALVRTALAACQPERQARFRDGGATLAALERELRSDSARRLVGRRLVAGLAGAVVFGGLAWAGFQWMTPARVHANFITHPFGATVVVDGRTLRGADGVPLTTPCTAEDLPARPRRVTFQRPGLPDLEVGIVDFGTTRQVVARWDDAAAP